MMRTLDPQFFSDLDGGILAPLVATVRSDSTLCLELRGNCIVVYYRGGKLTGVERTVNGYFANFATGYSKGGTQLTTPPDRIYDTKSLNEWLDAWPFFKRAMDRYFVKKKGNHKCESRQQFVRDNNFRSVARPTDYYVCDFAYRQFDMIAVHWPSRSSREREKVDNRRLVFVKVAHGDKALGGVHNHIKVVSAFLGQPNKVDDLKEDLVNVFNQKRRLGLVDCDGDLASFSSERPILLLALANHDPGSSKLRDVLGQLPQCPNAELRLGTAIFFGYGLYDQGVHTIADARSRFGNYI